MRLVHSVAVLTLTVVCAGSLAAQQPAGQQQPAPPPMTNLKIIPKDVPRPVVIQAMQRFTQALGVNCAYCHVDEGRGGRQDYASDEKPTKNAARGMLLMMRDINTKVPEVVGKSADAATHVDCVTCHRGVAIPKQLADIVADAARTGGAAAGLAKYKELRERYYGAQAYDFSEASLVLIAQRANQAQKPDDALAYLKANLEYYPKSARTYLQMSQIDQAKGDKDAAMKDAEKALELDPTSNQAKMRVQQLKGQ